jgi:hypothetical protein
VVCCGLRVHFFRSQRAQRKHNEHKVIAVVHFNQKTRQLLRRTQDLTALFKIKKEISIDFFPFPEVLSGTDSYRDEPL